MSSKQHELTRLRAKELKYYREQRDTPNYDRSLPPVWSEEYESALRENVRTERIQAHSKLLSDIEQDQYHLLNPDNWTLPDSAPINDDDSLINDHILLHNIPKVHNVYIPSTCPSEFNNIIPPKSDIEQDIHPIRYHLTEQEQKNNPLLTISECIQFTDINMNANWFYQRILRHEVAATWHITPQSPYKQPRVPLKTLVEWNQQRGKQLNPSKFNPNTITLIQDFKDPDYYEVLDWYRTLGYVSYQDDGRVNAYDIQKNIISDNITMTEAFSLLFSKTESFISSPRVRRPYRSFTEKTERRDEILFSRESFARRYNHNMPSLTSISTWEPSSMLAKERSKESLRDPSMRKLPRKK